eukprot:3985495-Pleurochrysis_carterae.AAC.9
MKRGLGRGRGEEEEMDTERGAMKGESEFQGVRGSQGAWGEAEGRAEGQGERTREGRAHCGW